MILGSYRNQINQLSNISPNRYENIFRMYKTQGNQYYYNLLQSLYINGAIDPNKVFIMSVTKNQPWSIISYNAYGTTDLWWLIALTNKIYNPIKGITNSTNLTCIRPEYIPAVLQEIGKASS